MTRGSIVFKIRGLDCSEEVSLLKREVGPVVGGAERLSFDLLTGRMTVRLADGALPPGVIEGAVSRAGLTAELCSDDMAAAEDAGDDAARRVRRNRIAATATSGLATALALASHALMYGSVGAALGVGSATTTQGVPPVSRLLYGIAIGLGLWHVAPKAWLAVRNLRGDMHLLMTVAILGAVAIGEWFEAATVAFLFALSLALEAWSLGRARRAVSALLDLAPPRARVLRADGTEDDRPVRDVPVGTAFVVRPGERIPLDGTIERGRSAVDEAPITGESLPRDKEPGAEVFAGTINGDGALEVRSTHPAQDTVLARIIRTVGEAQNRRARVESWVDGFARVYTPLVMFLAAAVALLPPLLAGQAWSAWIYKGLVLLVIACPCALVISTPVSIVAALATAARHGVLIKGGIFVELPARLRTICLDKTGTITEGRLRVAEVVALGESSESQVLERAAALEARSGHPIARAIVAHARQLRIEPVAAADVQDRGGRGVSGTIGGRSYWAGSHRFVEEKFLDSPGVQARIARMASGGRTVIAIGDESTVLGLVALEDAIRADAPRVIAELRSLGLGRIVMLTGDNAATAESVAATVGIDDVRAELLPADKLSAVEELVQSAGPVAMIGDGVNDAPAMARADLGIAMGTAGSDAAIEAADIALMADDLTRIPWLIRHSGRTLRIVRQNIALSLIVKAAFVALTVLGYASLWAAITADMGASLVVIGNGLRLLSDESTR